MSIGFIYKFYTGSNNESQFTKVFWHRTRIIHGLLYGGAAYYLFIGKGNLAYNILLGDLLFSILYRIITDQ